MGTHQQFPSSSLSTKGAEGTKGEGCSLKSSNISQQWPSARLWGELWGGPGRSEVFSSVLFCMCLAYAGGCILQLQQNLNEPCKPKAVSLCTSISTLHLIQVFEVKKGSLHFRGKKNRHFQGDTEMLLVHQFCRLFISCFGGLFGLLLCVLQGCFCQTQGRWCSLKGVLSLKGSPTMDRLWQWRTQWVFMWEEIPEGQYWLFIIHLKYLPCNLGLRQILMTEVTSHSIWLKNRMLS